MRMDSLFDSTIGNCRSLHFRCQQLNVVAIVALFFAGLALPSFAGAQTTVNNNWPPSITPTPGTATQPSTPPPSSFQPSSVGNQGVTPTQFQPSSANGLPKKQPPGPQAFLGNPKLTLSPTSPPASNATATLSSGCGSVRGSMATWRSLSRSVARTSSADRFRRTTTCSPGRVF